jgi:GNAT superfamily N-acetyltransferase
VDGTAGDEEGLVGAGFGVSREDRAHRVGPRAARTGVRRRDPAAAGDDDWRQALGLHIPCIAPDGGHVTEGFSTAQVAAYRVLSESADATWYGAFAEGRLVSWLGTGADGTGLARFQSVETDPDPRRWGLASALVHHAGLTALANGVTTLVIVADPGYHAIGIYRALGFAETEMQVQLTRRPGVHGG